MSMMITKVDGSADEKNGLEYTVDVKSLGLLSTTIDKASGGILKGEEVQLKCSPEYAEGANIDLTLVQVAKKHDEKAISDKTTTEKAESENAIAKSVSAQQVFTEKLVVEKAVEKKVSITKSTVANVAIESLRRRNPQPRRSPRSRWIRVSCRRAPKLRKRIRTQRLCSQLTTSSSCSRVESQMCAPVTHTTRVFPTECCNQTVV